LPAENVYIFDACAIIALLDDEPGAEVVEELLAGEGHRCVIHLLNVCEVYYHIYRSADQQRADKLRGVLESYGFEVEESLVPLLWQEASRLKAEWRRVSLVDCFALALAIQKGATLVTSDHHELDPIAEAGLCPFRFIR
jgi:predicted nucleic acid-binding protein